MQKNGTKNPSYVVFKMVTVYGDRVAQESGDVKGAEAWVPVLGYDEQGALVITRAPSRKAAIEKATGAMESQAKAGKFAVVPAAEFVPIGRKVRVEEVSEFE